MIYLLLFLEFFKIGLFCFGGAFGMIPLIEETVLAHEWLTQEEFFDLIGVCESTPGPIAVNMATYIGAVQGGVAGSIAATLGVVTPSFVIILVIASVLKGLTKNRYFKGFLQGVKPVIVGLILSTGVLLLAKVLGMLGENGFSPDPVSLLVFPLLAAAHFAAPKLLGRKLRSTELILLSAGLGIGISLLVGCFLR